MTILSPSSPSILLSISEIRNTEISDPDQYTLWSRRIQIHPVKQHEPDHFIRRQLDDLQIERQDRLIESASSPRVFLSSGGIATERQKSRSAVRIFSESESDKVHRLTGPIQFILKLLDCWKLNQEDAIKLLGFEDTESEFVFKVLEGNEILRGRDAKDRLLHLFSMRKSLHGIFRDLDVENDWLREPQSLLDGQAPMDLLLGGSMEDILLVREYVDTIVGK